MAQGPIAPSRSTETYSTAVAEIWIDKDDICHVRCLPGSVHGINEARENIAAIPRDRRRSRPVLVDIREVKSIDREAREYYRSDQNSDITACAIVVGSPLSRIIGNFFVGMSRMTVPIRLFTAEEEAIRWLQPYSSRNA